MFGKDRLVFWFCLEFLGYKYFFYLRVIFLVVLGGNIYEEESRIKKSKGILNR